LKEIGQDFGLSGPGRYEFGNHCTPLFWVGGADAPAIVSPGPFGRA
jgi:hypothetical protein